MLTVQRLALWLVLWFTASLYGRVNIEQKHWEANLPGGYCAWISLKTLLLHHGMKELAGKVIADEDRLGGGLEGFDLVDGQFVRKKLPPGGCSPEKMRKRLDQYKLSYKMQSPPDENTDILYDAVERNFGAIVTIKQGLHAVTLIDITKDKHPFTYVLPDGRKETRQERMVEYIDSNAVRAWKDGESKKLSTTKTSLTWFVENAWDGWCVVIYPSPPEPEVVQRLPSVPLPTTPIAPIDVSTLVRPEYRPLVLPKKSKD